MSIHNIQVRDIIRKFFINICFLELSDEFRRDSVVTAMVNEPSVVTLRFDYIIKVLHYLPL